VKRTSSGLGRRAPHPARLQASGGHEPSVAIADETLRERKARARRLLRRLHDLYPEAETALHHGSALELLVATILSAQCTDARVNIVAPALFRRYRTAAEFASADRRTIEALIRPTGFFRTKARALVGLGRALEARHGGEVPATMEDLVALPGVGRKTASVVLGSWFGIPALPVDTHVARLSGRLALSAGSDPARIEHDLRALFPDREWVFLSHALIWHGRRVCKARRPQCASCRLRQDCPSADGSEAGRRG